MPLELTTREARKSPRRDAVRTVLKPPRDHRGTHLVGARARPSETFIYLRVCSSGGGTRTHNLRINSSWPRIGPASAAGRLRREPGLHILPSVSEMTANTMRARALPLVAPCVQGPYGDLKVGGDLGWRCQASRPGRRPSGFVPRPPPGIVTTTVAPTCDASARPASEDVSRPGRFSSSRHVASTFRQLLGLGSPITWAPKWKRPCDQGL
jgi:hypothetical protein